MQKLRSVQVLRGVAACGVVLMHAHFFGVADRLRPNWTQLGAAGVDLFFVVSGFIMASIPKRSARSFVLDRLWRIYPMWWAALLPWLLIIPTDWGSRVEAVFLWPVSDLSSLPYLKIRWTLSYELLFYFGIALSIRRGPALPLLLLGLALACGFATNLFLFKFIGNPILFEFVLGAFIAKLPRDARMAPALLAVAAMIFVAAPLKLFNAEVALSPSESWIRVILWGFPAALLLYAAISSESHFRFRLIAPLVLLGDASYSIYLFHTAGLRLLELNWIIEFFLSVALGVAMWWLIERRLLALKGPVAASLSRGLGRFQPVRTITAIPPVASISGASSGLRDGE